MRNLVIVIEYDDSAFRGWQIQPGVETVQGRVEQALFEMLGHKVRLTASGRTDVGVHAKGQVANFYTENPISCYKLPLGLNVRLWPHIAVKDCFEVPLAFDSRRSAKKKTYCYRLYCSRTPSPLRDNTHCQVYKALSVDSMRKGAEYLVGRHDFAAFCASGGSSLTTEREIYSCRVEAFGDTVEIYVTGSAFLYNMVRIIAGTLSDVGSGKIPPEEVGEILRSGDRRRAGRTLKAGGLTLESVEYDFGSDYNVYNLRGNSDYNG